MQAFSYQSIDAAPSEWLDAGSTETSGTLYAGKSDPPPPSPPPVPEDPSIIRGTNGDDVLQGTTGDNTIYGGKGQDTVVYRGTLGEYELSFDHEHWQYKLVDKVSGRDGSDILDLYSIERLQYDGVTVLLDGWGGATLEDGTPLLARYEPPTVPADPQVNIGDGDGYVGIWPVETDFDFGIVAVEGTEIVTPDIGLAGIATIAASFITADA
jgi:Ca2+-binding RTX toxin-like protein